MMGIHPEVFFKNLTDNSPVVSSSTTNRNLAHGSGLGPNHTSSTSQSGDSFRDHVRTLSTEAQLTHVSSGQTPENLSQLSARALEFLASASLWD